MTLQVIESRPTRSVPCGTCGECCIGDAVFIHPECGDDASQYETEVYEGRVVLAHKPNGECIYLERGKGCSIWERRPTICRELDCRALVNVLGEKRMNEMGMNRIVAAARRLRKNGVGSCAA
jgi:hypothetical protein